MGHFWQYWESEKKNTQGLSENDKIDHFWQNWRSKIIEITYCTHTISHNLNSSFPKWQNGPLVTIMKSENIHGPLRKWQNWAFLTKIVWWLTTYGVEKSYLSHNLKTAFPKWQNGPFWQYWESEKNNYGPLSKWQIWIFDKILQFDLSKHIV